MWLVFFHVAPNGFYGQIRIIATEYCESNLRSRTEQHDQMSCQLARPSFTLDKSPVAEPVRRSFCALFSRVFWFEKVYNALDVSKSFQNRVTGIDQNNSITFFLDQSTKLRLQNCTLYLSADSGVELSVRSEMSSDRVEDSIHYVQWENFTR